MKLSEKQTVQVFNNQDATEVGELYKLYYDKEIIVIKATDDYDYHLNGEGLAYVICRYTVIIKQKEKDNESE
jgi:hypothetical protein